MKHGKVRGMTDADLLEIVRDRLRCRADHRGDILGHVEAALELLSAEEKE